MYNVNEIDISYQKFLKYIDIQVKSLKSTLSNIESDINNCIKITKIKDNFSTLTILENKDYLIDLIPEIEENINVIEFFKDNDALNVDQVLNEVDKIYSIFIRKFDTTTDDILRLKNRSVSLKTKLKKLEKILSDGIVAVDDNIVEQSNLSEKEKLDIYTKIALNSINKKEITNTEIIEDSNKYDELFNTYNDLKETIKYILSKYYYLIQDKDYTYVNLAKAMIDYNKSKNHEFNYVEEELVIELLELLDNKNNIEKIINDNSKVSDIEVLIELIKENFEIIDTLSKEYELEQKEKGSNMPSNLYILLDDNNKAPFDVNQIDKSERYKINNLLDKLSKGIYDYERGTKHTRLQTNYKDDIVFINKTSDVACSYIRLDDSKVLIINIDTYSNIYDRSNYILNKYNKNIKKQKEKLLKQDENAINLSNSQLDIIYDSIGKGIRL